MCACLFIPVIRILGGSPRVVAGPDFPDFHHIFLRAMLPKRGTSKKSQKSDMSTDNHVCVCCADLVSCGRPILNLKYPRSNCIYGTWPSL